jgi:hypothetical protein
MPIRLITDAVNVIETIKVMNRYNSHPFHVKFRGFNSFEIIKPIKNRSRGKFVLKDESFKSMVSVINPPEWAIVLGVVEYEKPPKYFEKPFSTFFDPSRM